MRGNTTERGYGAAHQALRARLAPIVARGTTLCARCGERIQREQAWDLDHRDDRRGYLGPSHRHSKDCPAGGNRATAKRTRRSRQW